MPEFCSSDCSLTVKEIFGVAEWASISLPLLVSYLSVCDGFLLLLVYSEDAEEIRTHTLSEGGILESLEKMVDDGSDSENPPEHPSSW